MAKIQNKRHKWQGTKFDIFKWQMTQEQKNYKKRDYKWHNTYKKYGCKNENWTEWVQNRNKLKMTEMTSKTQTYIPRRQIKETNQTDDKNIKKIDKRQTTQT